MVSVIRIRPVSCSRLSRAVTRCIRYREVQLHISACRYVIRLQNISDTDMQLRSAMVAQFTKSRRRSALNGTCLSPPRTHPSRHRKGACIHMFESAKSMIKPWHIDYQVGDMVVCKVALPGLGLGEIYSV